jgi:O-acetyl-ADP-ribose deacetylase (regulator of RNase III)
MTVTTLFRCKFEASPQAMNKIRYVEGDIFSHAFDYPKRLLIPHVCNDRGKFGAGFVNALASHIPVAKIQYLEWFASRGTPNDPRFGLGKTQFVPHLRDGKPDVYVANMVAQTLGGKRPLSYIHLASCLERVRDVAMDCGFDIMAPAFGSGLAGGNWAFIEEMIKDAWITAGLDVTICILPTEKHLFPINADSDP